ncbi:MAG: DUF456 domain-containing protein [Omnitrophica WOR_2 bacterium]
MNPFLDVSSFTLTIIIMLVGLFGLVIPVFPGILVIWVAALIYGLLVGFNTLGIVIFVLITLLMIAGSIIDNILMGIGARRGGASWFSILMGTIAGVAGTILLPPFGGLIASPLAVMLVELLRLREWRKAWIAVRGLAVGWGLSFVARFGIGVVMIGLWAVWAWKR